VDPSAKTTTFLQENIGKMVYAGKARSKKGGGWTMPVLCAVAGETRQIGEVVVDEQGDLVSPPVEELMDRLSDALSAEETGQPAPPAPQQEVSSSLQALLEVIEAGEDIAPGEDPLTELHSHSHYQERLEEEVERARRYGLPFSCLFADLDDFGGFNQEHGHRLGDALLRAVGHILAGALRGTDFVAHWGADEFAIIAQGEAQDTARAAERLRERIGAEPFRIRDGDEPLQVTVSVGGASFPSEDAPDGAALVTLARDMLSAAKAAGGNRVMMARSKPPKSRRSGER
jgi:diguanylate cyclase (GGDEF)-like protein